MSRKLRKEGYNTAADSLKVIPKPNGAMLIGNHYIQYLGLGRDKTKNDGDGSVREAIDNWVDSKGIKPKPINGILPTIDQLKYLITRKIHRDGYEIKVEDLFSTIDNFDKGAILGKLVLDLSNSIELEIITEFEKLKV